MNIHEYQGKELMSRFGVPTPSGFVAHTPEEAKQHAATIGKKVAVKAQVHIGGRGKAGGIKLADNPDQAFEHAGKIIGMDIKGLKVGKVLVEEAVDIAKEFYLGIILDRTRSAHCIMFSTMGGMDIEEVAEKHPDKLKKVWVNPLMGLLDHQVRELVWAYEMEPDVRKQLGSFIRTLFGLYTGVDCMLAEINPLAITKEGKMIAADAKFTFDENAMFKHPELEAYRETGTEGDPLEQKAHELNLAYVRLDGEVGVIGNGAGLVMGTLDTVNRVGGKAANFLDVGGGANAKVVTNALTLVASDTNVKGVLFNIFGGITRGDEVAKGIVQGVQATGVKLPIVIRLAGTNSEEGRAILAEAGYETAATMEEAAEKIVALTR